MTDDDATAGLRRRDALLALGGLGLGLGGLAGYEGTTGAPDAVAADCVLSKEVTEGPYWVPNSITRRDVTGGRPGVPLALHLTVLDASTCQPINRADVELWQADNRGVYSAVQGNTQRFLRGHQKADAKGRVLFDTIYPGWYRGRTPHIHVKVHVGGQVVHTGQLFFSDKVSAAVYRTSAYRSRGQADTTNAQDGVYGQNGRAQLRLAKRAAGKGYRGSMSLGVRR
jgi:protocatechuate 3,4-dioxygenase beta subunit